MSEANETKPVVEGTGEPDKEEKAPSAKGSDKQKNDDAQTNKTKEEPKKEESVKKGGMFDEESHDTVITDADTYTLSPCCCCMCACSHDRVGAATCFGCLPIRCGILFIAIIQFALTIILYTVTFFQLLNEYLPWWYCFITMILLVPMAIGASFMVYFFAKDSRSTRVKLFSAIIQSLISVGLWAVWNLIFFLGMYKRDVVYSGMGAANDEANYHSTPKRTYLFIVLAEATFIMVFLTYFICVSNEYCSLMNEAYDRDQKEEDRIAAEKKKEEAAAKKKAKEEKAAAEKERKIKEREEKDKNS